MSTRQSTAIEAAKPRDSHSPEYETSDFYLSCFLRCVGYELSRTRREGRRMVLVFRDRADREATLLSYYRNEGRVAPLSFVRAIQELKSLIHNL